jgi:diguanylate cyclase (GGDEF)-like protein
MRRLSTRNQLIFLGTVIVATIIGGTGLIISMQRQATIDAFQVGIMNLDNGMSQQTAYFLTQTDQLLKRIQIEVASPSGAGLAAINAGMQSQPVTDLLSDLVARVSWVDSLILVDADGKVVNSSQGWTAAPMDLSGQDFFSHFRLHDDPALFAGIPMQDPASGAWTIPIARRIDSAPGQFAGVVVAQLSMSSLAAFYQLAMPVRRTLYLVRSDGTVLLRYPARAADIGRRVPDTSPWYSIVARGSGVYVAPAYFSPAPVIADVHRLHNLPFVVETSVTQEDALYQWRRERIWLVLGGLVSALGAVGLLLLFGRQFNRIEASERSLAAKNAELDITHRQLEATLANLSQGVCYFDENNKLLVFNRRYCQLIGLPGAAVRVGMSAAEIAERCIAAGTFRDQTLSEYLASLDARVRACMPVDEVYELPDGRTISKHFEPLAGQGWVLTLEDISERRAAEQKIAYLAHHDLLTGLANRALFREQLGRAFTDTISGQGFAMLYLDLDRFKAVNDTYGHKVGDGLLIAVADRLRAAVRMGDSIARLGGDEFVILQRNVSDESEPIALGRKIVDEIGKPFVIDGHKLNIGVSIGIALAARDRMSPERLLQDADFALYRSKQAGRATLSVFDSTMQAGENAGGDAGHELAESLPQGRS